VVVEHYRPATGRRVTVGGKASNLDLRAFGLQPTYREVLCFSNGQVVTAAGDDLAAHTGGRDWLEVNLLSVDQIFVVKIDILRVKLLNDRLV
jgi:hypothetical protein